MAECKDCFHHIACDGDVGFGYFKCPHFKNAADVVEVVRCKDCGAYLEYSHCEYMGLNGFCSLGFRTPKKEVGRSEQRIGVFE